MFDRTSISYLSPKLRIYILIFLILFAVLSLSWLTFGVLRNRSEVVSVAADLFKMFSAGSAVWGGLLIYSRGQGTGALISQTNAFLTKIIPDAIRRHSILELEANVGVELKNEINETPHIEHCLQPDNIACSYRLCWETNQIRRLRNIGHELGHKIEFIVYLNVKTLHLIIQLSKQQHQHYASSMDAIKNAFLFEDGWSCTYEGFTLKVESGFSVSVFEMCFKKTLPNDFLYLSAEQLFAANDIAGGLRAARVFFIRHDMKISENTNNDVVSNPLTNESAVM